MENNNDVFKKESSWNPLTKKQENTFGFTDRKEISDFAQKIIQKHAPEELKNYDLKIKFNDVKAQTWANIKHINKQLDVHEWNLKRGYDKNVIKLNISKNLLHPAIPLILKKNVLIHELTHLFSQRSHVFYNLKTRKWELREKEKLKKGFDSDEKIEKLTQGHTKEFAEQYHFLLKKVMGIDVKKFPAFKYIAGKNKKEYKNISLKKDFINVWHRNNFIRLGAKKGWLGMSEKDFNDYIEKKLEMHKELRKDISELKIDLKENREDEIINNMIFRNNVLIKRLKVHQEQSSDFTWDRQIAIDKLEESNKKWNKIWEQKKKERKILEEEEEKRKEIEQQKKIEKMNLEWEKQLQKEKEWETNPPSENDPEREKYEIWKQKHDYNQKIKLINNQLDQDIDKYFELKNSNKEISKEIKDRIVENLGRFNELTNDFYYHERLDELRNDKDLTDLIDEYEEMRYEQEREEEEDDDDSYWNDD